MMSYRLSKLLDPVLADLGYELWHVESVGSGKNAVLRIFIDSPEGIDIEDCEKVSHEVSAMLDVADEGSAAYQLEVSSPGLDRPLVTCDHFQRFTGEAARITTFAPVDGRRKFRGVIRSADRDVVELASADAIYRFAIADIAKARLDPVFEDAR